MTRKINLNFMFVSAVSILLTAFFTTLISYQLFQKEVFSDLSSFAQTLENLDLIRQMQQKGTVQPENELRITWIRQDGRVLYDSYAGDSVSDSHADRPEIIQAAESGEGFCVRKSQTMEQSIFFYALKLEDKTFVRIAKQAGSIWSIYWHTLPAVLLTAVLVFFLSMQAARYLTKAFVRPIAQTADHMDHLEEADTCQELADTYQELMPFIRRIRSQHEEAVQNAKARQEFAANVSHELKTPLTSISGYSELIAGGMASKKQARHFAQEIYSNAQRLLGLINDILKLSELDDAEKNRFLFVRVDVCALARRCVRQMKPAAKKQGVSISFKGRPLYISADKGLMEELIFNLCHNALRYNKKGGHVWVTVSDQLIVRDDGIGISPKDQKRVFERFFRVDKSRSKKTGGTGLGLAIVKHIAAVHDAGLSLESEEGKGTKICVKFADGQPQESLEEGPGESNEEK